MSVTQRVRRRTVSIGSPTGNVPEKGFPSGEITYKGYRIEPGSYSVNNSAWSPRVVVSVRTDEGWSRGQPLYSTNPARFPTRDEADHRALDVARAWIDTAVERRRD